MAVKTLLLASFSSFAKGNKESTVPFKDFIDGVRESTFENLMARNDAYPSKVRDELSFLEMKQHILSLYEGVNVTHSYLDDFHFDCVTIESQPSLRGGNPATPPPPVEVASDQANAAQEPSPCKPGTIPMLRVTLERTMRHATVQHFFAKSPHGPAPQPGNSTVGSGVAAIPHKYAHAYQSVQNTGGSSSLGLWDPEGYFTLSQQWYSAYTSQHTIQTAECGNVRTPSFGADAVLFLYRTNNGYQANSGCYNLECTGFVQVDSSVQLGKKWQSYSSDGNRVAATYSYQLYQGNWWFQLNGKNVGYYPTSIYEQVDATAMAVGATEVDFGGETTTDSAADSWPQMGSGKFADAGYSHAAAQTNIVYYSGGSAYAAHLTPSEQSSSCYTIAEHENDPNDGTWFTFGGPGGGFTSCGSTNEKIVMV